MKTNLENHAAASYAKPPFAYRFQRTAHYAPRSAPLSAKLALGLIRNEILTPRHLRALEYLLKRQFTVRGIDGLHLLLPQTSIDLRLAEMCLTDSAPARDAILCYQNISDEALAMPDLRALEASRLIERARAVKYQLGSRFLDREVALAAVTCLTLIERVVEELSRAGKAPRVRLRPEPLREDESGALSIEFDHDEAPGLPEDEVGFIFEIEAEEPRRRGDRVPEGQKDHLHLVDLELEGQADWTEPPSLTDVSIPASIGEQANLRSVPPGKARSSRAGRAVVAGAGRRRWTKVWMGVTTANLLVILVSGFRLLAGPSLPPIEAGSRYQTFTLPEGLNLPVAGARRIDDLLVLNADKRWASLSIEARQDLAEHLARHLMSKGSIKRMLVVDESGKRLAIAGEGQPTQTW